MSAPSLHEVQRWVKARIRPQGTASATTMPAGLLNAQRGTPGEERLAVYADGYVTRMREALAEVYEAVHHVLGDRPFHALAHAYAARHPSHDYNLSVAGRHLPTFLGQWPQTERLPFLPDLARLEWAISEAVHAFDERPLDPQRLDAVPLGAWDRRRLVLQPSVRLLSSAWPIVDIWQARTQPREQVNIDLVDHPQRVLVFRYELQARCMVVDARQYAVLEGLVAGRALGEVCGALARAAGEESLPLADWFADWAKHGLFRDVATRE